MGRIDTTKMRPKMQFLQREYRIVVGPNVHSSINADGLAGGTGVQKDQSQWVKMESHTIH